MKTQKANAANQLCIKNNKGYTAVFSPFGASLNAMYVPDKNGSFENIVYHNPLAYGGVIIAPIAGRIRNGEVTIKGKQYKMQCNDNNNCLHSGMEGTGKAFWNIQEHTNTKIVFEIYLQSGKCGLPGNRIIKAEYSLNDTALSLLISIHTDSDTFVNPTSHIYWNLSADFATPAHEHLLKLPSDLVYFNDNQHLPQKACSTSGTPFDFNTESMWQTDLSAHEQLKCAQGYNHAFVLNQRDKTTLSHPQSGRTLSISTNASHMVFYSGGFLPVQGCAVAFEPQLVPDAPFLLGEKLPILKAGHTFEWKTQFDFGIL